MIFLYLDTGRIGAFLSQFEPNGHLQSLTSTEAVLQDYGSKYQVGGSIGVPSMLGLNTTGDKHEGGSHSSSSAKVYDPVWQNALALLDYLDRNSLIQRGIVGSPIGQFVLETSKLTIFDLSIMRAIFASARTAEAIASSSTLMDGAGTPTKQSRRLMAGVVQDVFLGVSVGYSSAPA